MKLIAYIIAISAASTAQTTKIKFHRYTIFIPDKGKFFMQV